MTTIEPADNPGYEYAIELPGQGWLLNMIPGTYSVVAKPQIISADHIDDARDVLVRAQKFYERIGAKAVGDELRLVVRSVTVVRSDWTDA